MLAFTLAVGVTCLTLAGVYGYGWLESQFAERVEVNNRELAGHFGRAAPLNASEAHAPSLVSAFPGRYVNPKYWDDPANIGADGFGLARIPIGFEILPEGEARASAPPGS